MQATGFWGLGSQAKPRMEGWKEGRKEAWTGEGRKASALNFTFPCRAVLEWVLRGVVSRTCCLYYWETGALHHGSVKQSFYEWDSARRR